MEDYSFLMHRYGELLNKQDFDLTQIDDSKFEAHKPFLKQLDAIESGGVLVFDTIKREHIYISPSFANLFGYKIDDMHETGNDFFDSRVHPQDGLMLLKSGICHLEYFFSTPQHQRKDLKFKLINEYRIKNSEDKYIRVIEQFVPLEKDHKGNIWLVLSVMDISPEQDLDLPGRSRLHVVSTGELFEFPPKTDVDLSEILTKREAEILQLIAKGLISKQIADNLFISVNTVNTHRQRIIEKLNVSNTFEAIQFAHQIGLFAS